MFYLRYAMAELRRRKVRTLLTAAGLAVGIALVITVNALSTGLSDAQNTVLKPLTGVGTDMSVTRPLKLSASGGPFGRFSPGRQRQFRRERGGSRFGFGNLKPGQHFSTDNFVSGGQLGFGVKKVAQIRTLSTVREAAGSLTLTAIHISGTVPKTSPASGGGFGGPPGGFRQRGSFGGPRNVNFNARTVTGVDQTKPGLGAITPSQITKGAYFASSDGKYQAILSTSYADSNSLSVGSTFKLAGKDFTVAGLASPPLGGSSSDIYVELVTLQKLAGWKNQVNSVQVRVESGNVVSSTVPEIKSTLHGAQVTTAQDLASRVGGSLADAKNLASSLGTALEIVGLLAALLIAMLLTLASVSKRTREIGALRAFGWSKALVLRQISLESLAQGILGGIIGVALGVGSAALISVSGWTLNATIPGASPAAGRFGFGGPFGLGRAASPVSGSTAVRISAPTDASLLILAVVVAVVAGIVVGAVGGFRASRLRPAEALRNVE